MARTTLVLLVLLLAACSETSSGSLPEDGGPSESRIGMTADAGTPDARVDDAAADSAPAPDARPPDAAAPDAAPDAAPPDAPPDAPADAPVVVVDGSGIYDAFTRSDGGCMFSDGGSCPNP